jgi:cytosine/creatinine deaminase
MWPHGLPARKPFSHFIESRAVEDVAQLAEQVIRKRHAFKRRTRLELAMQVRRYIADLNHNRHAFSILTCAAHVNGTAERLTAPHSRFSERLRSEYKRFMTNTLDYAAMLAVALQEARTGLAEGGIPIGAAIFDSTTSKLIGAGHNRRVQQGDPSVHGETDAFRNAGRQRSYRNLVMVTTLAPCWYCSGLVRQFGFGTVVVGESRNFQGGMDWLRSLGINVIDLDSAECALLLADYIRAHPAVWNEDIGEE